MTEDCITVELLGVTLNADGSRSYRYKVTSDCDRGLSFLAFELPAGATAIDPMSTAPIDNIENPGGNGGSSPSYRNLKFELGGDFKDGDMATFSYTLPADAAYDGEVRIRAKYSTTVTDLTISLAGCPVGTSPPPSDDCDCEGGVKELTLGYDGDAAATVTIYNSKNADPDKILFSGTLSPGEEFTIRSSTLDERKFKSNISFYIDGAKDTELHTSCSEPIGSGQEVGGFTVVSGVDRMDNMLCPFDPDGESGNGNASRTDTGIPTEFEVGQAYPNPFSRQATIGVDLPEAAVVQVVVYDVQGSPGRRPPRRGARSRPPPRRLRRRRAPPRGCTCTG